MSAFAPQSPIDHSPEEKAMKNQFARNVAFCICATAISEANRPDTHRSPNLHNASQLVILLICIL
jgi:hypothetical protein